MLNLSFSSAIPGTLVDKDGEATGFTYVQPNIDGSEYDPSRIDLDLTTGNLVLTATQGSNTLDNTLKNALQVGFDATRTFTVSTRLENPFANLTTTSQQGGLVIGSSQDNYVKLVAVRTGRGPKIQLFREENGSAAGVGEITGLNWRQIRTLDLYLTGDPVTNTITAAYRVNSNTTEPILITQKFQPDQPASFFADSDSARAGILAFTKDAPDVPVTFNYFGMAQNVNINFQPSTAAVINGYIVDSGEAYDPTRGFGWVTEASLSSNTHTPLSITPYTRQRNRTGVDPRLDTLVHMEYAGTTAAAWEYAVPNGTYAVVVSVGDQPRPADGVYDSINTINVEGVNAINGFQSTPNQEYQLVTATVNVNDGRLTVDSIGGTNTKLNYLQIISIPPGNHPRVTGSVVASNETGVYLDTAVNVDVSLPTVGAGVDLATLNTVNVKLYRTKDNAPVPGVVNTSGGGDAIVYQPSVPLEPNTNYTFRVTSGVSDESGATFIPYSATFNTGIDSIAGVDPRVNFTRSTVYAGEDPISSLATSPDGSMLYATTLTGKIRRWTIDSSGELTNAQTFSPDELAGRAIIGIAFDPNDADNLWITHNDPLRPIPADDFTGRISKLTLEDGSDFDADIEDYAFGLPRASKDHLTESLVFGPDGNLYVSQGSNSAMGAPNPGWYNRPERLLSATVLQIDPTLTPPEGGFNLQTEEYGDTTGDYNPYETDAPVQIYATGIRNAYDLVWHSNGNLYAPGNGSAAGGITPDDPATEVNESIVGVSTQNDYLFNIVEGGYYGHPNPLHGNYILNGGNPTSGVDPAQVVEEVTTTGKVYVGYPVGTQPDPDYRGFAYDFGRNRSPNGAIEYQSDSFGGALRNKLLVVEYSGGDDILALAPGDDGNIPRGNVTRVISGLTDPIDLIEDTQRNVGNLYVAELINDGDSGYSGRISLLRTT